MESLVFICNKYNIILIVTTQSKCVIVIIDKTAVSGEVAVICGAAGAGLFQAAAAAAARPVAARPSPARTAPHVLLHIT